jgi:hypothetical protein
MSIAKEANRGTLMGGLLAKHFETQSFRDADGVLLARANPPAPPLLRAFHRTETRRQPIPEHASRNEEN